MALPGRGPPAGRALEVVGRVGAGFALGQRTGLGEVRRSPCVCPPHSHPTSSTPTCSKKEPELVSKRLLQGTEGRKETVYSPSPWLCAGHFTQIGPFLTGTLESPEDHPPFTNKESANQGSHSHQRTGLRSSPGLRPRQHALASTQPWSPRAHSTQSPGSGRTGEESGPKTRTASNLSLLL